MIAELHALTLAAASSTAHITGDVLAAVPDPGQGIEPPGAGGILTILGWFAWLVFAACVYGVLRTGGKMALAYRRGEGGEAVQDLGWVLGGAIIGASAAAIVGVVLV